MSKLSAFLHPVTTQEEKEVVISNRFQDEKGNPVPFKIRALSQEENDKIIKAATRQIKVNGQPLEKLDSADYNRRVVVAGTVEPDFQSKEMCDAYGVLDPLQVPGKMLFAGEFSQLNRAIAALSGFNSVEEDLKN